MKKVFEAVVACLEEMGHQIGNGGFVYEDRYIYLLPSSCKRAVRVVFQESRIVIHRHAGPSFVFDYGDPQLFEKIVEGARIVSEVDMNKSIAMIMDEMHG